MMNFDFTIFLNKVAMGMVPDHPLVHWLENPKRKDDVLDLLNPKQTQHLEHWILHHLANAKTWGNV